MSSDPELREFLARHKDATIQMLNGDESAWLELALRSADASLFGPFGGAERGWVKVGPRYEATAAGFRAQQHADASLDIELISSGVSGALAYVVTLERGQVHVGEDRESRTWQTRVTHILRRDQGRWLLAHRHMDHLPESYTPPLQ